MKVVVIGAGPAGLAAAEVLCSNGVAVEVFDAMPSAGRKFLLAGRGGLNLTHSEPLETFLSRYRPRNPLLDRAVRSFGPDALRDWSDGLGVPTFVGSSGRVFPRDFKAAPLLRAWLHRLRAGGVVFHMRQRWLDLGEDGRSVRLAAPDGERTVRADAVVLALGGASWPRLGSDGAWQSVLQARGIALRPLVPANCGFDVPGGWSGHFASRFAGQPFKSVAVEVEGTRRLGEFVATESGIEGSLVYAFSAALRDRIASEGHATLRLDLLPARSFEQVLSEVSHPRGSRSLSSHLKSRLGLEGIKLGILHERLSREALHDPMRLAGSIKSLALRLAAPRPIEEAISSAGGVCFESLDEHLMLQALPGVFCAGEMLDWEAPTGGYLLTASIATGRLAGTGVLRHLGRA
ncbi:TIGR03862 family flavoprotein [Ramlibacter sp. AW1]|uniref:TIGR03862 family flavoprotein n=1 Tax=Ramlibacter aurantiacus TaxID=2801330 RepID=A0A936ZID2_9BURK|nr:TIGR03862 family flavoprotein [Ramlibacter aurantiacus]MBL0420407.1 TIGR03862 family flavoprotein [Ramlibacter aurantiacus]